MRRVTHGDVVAVARFLLGVSAGQRAAVVAGLLFRAHAADKYARRFRRPHRDWGDGSLCACLRGERLPAEPAICAPEYLDCLITVLLALAERRDRFPGATRRQR